MQSDGSREPADGADDLGGRLCPCEGPCSSVVVGADARPAQAADDDCRGTVAIERGVMGRKLKSQICNIILFSCAHILYLNLAYFYAEPMRIETIFCHQI